MKVHWNYNYNLDLNLKTFTSVFKLVENLELALDENINFAYLFSKIT